MKTGIATISIHIIVWILLLMVPYFSTYQAIQSFAPQISEISYMPILVISGINITLFYTNYFWLIPKFLFGKRYLGYLIRFAATLIVLFSTAFLIFKLNGFNQEEFEATNPNLLLIRPIVNSNAFLMLAVTFVTSLVLAYNNRLKQAEAEKLSAKIASLKSQINPHFLFNTLNNIYAVAIDTSPKAADMVEKLSEMMRYTMRDTQEEYVPLEEEIDYITNYIELQKVRLDKNVRLDYNTMGSFGMFQIAPMLLMPFIENAFKHGVNSEQESHIKIRISVEEKELRLFVMNKLVEMQKETSERSGLGIENTQSRLKLIYSENHLLIINKDEEEFTVSLHINLA